MLEYIYRHPPHFQSGKSDWCYWSNCSSPPQFWPPGKRCEMRSSPRRDAFHESPAWSWVGRSAFQPHTPSGRWFGWAFLSSYSDSTPAHRDYRSCDLCGARTSVSSMPVGERTKQFIMEHLPFSTSITLALVMTSHGSLITAPAHNS